MLNHPDTVSALLWDSLIDYRTFTGCRMYIRIDGTLDEEEEFDRRGTIVNL